MDDDLDEELLPLTVREKAKLFGKEYGWRKDDFESVILAAKKVGLASLGGQPQFIFPGRKIELYWANYDSVDRQQHESWSEYVERSANEVLCEFHRVLSETDFEKEAEQWTYIREDVKANKNNPLDYLWFIGYFSAEYAG